MKRFDCWEGYHWWWFTGRNKFERTYRCLSCGMRATVRRGI